MVLARKSWVSAVLLYKNNWHDCLSWATKRFWHQQSTMMIAILSTRYLSLSQVIWCQGIWQIGAADNDYKNVQRQHEDQVVARRREGMQWSCQCFSQTNEIEWKQDCWRKGGIRFPLQNSTTYTIPLHLFTCCIQWNQEVLFGNIPFVTYITAYEIKNDALQWYITKDISVVLWWSGGSFALDMQWNAPKIRWLLEYTIA